MADSSEYWKGKTVLITGAGSGIGKALAERFAGYEAQLILTDIVQEDLDSVVHEFKQSVALSRCTDVRSKQEWQDLAETIEEHWGALDVLINNAGISCYDFFDQMSEELFDKVMDVNFNGVVQGCRTMLPLLAKSNDAMIVNISSIFGVITAPMLTPYHASKFAVRGFTECLSQEMSYEHPNINVVCVMPGGVKTRIAHNTESKSMDTKKFVDHFNKVALTTPAKAAEIIETGMKKRKAKIYVGPDAKIVHFISRLLPTNYPSVVGKMLGVDKLMARIQRKSPH